MINYLKYRVYTPGMDETNYHYEELILNKPNFSLQLGLKKGNFGIDRYDYQMSLGVEDGIASENVIAAEKFIFNLSSKIKNVEDIEKIEIELNRPEKEVHRTFIFNKGDFHDLGMIYTSTEHNSNIYISFIVDSMEQNYREQADI